MSKKLITLFEGDGTTSIGNATIADLGTGLPLAVVWCHRVFAVGFHFGTTPDGQGQPYNEISSDTLADDAVSTL